MTVSHRAYSVLDIKAVREDEWVIEGIASTPSPDRVGDIVEPMGAKFALPMPLLWQHDSRAPIGHVEFAKPTSKGIPFKARLIKPETVTSSILKERLQLAWDSLKSKLVSCVSIGFRILEYSILEGGGWRITEWEWMELSTVTIPAQPEAVITSLKSMDASALRLIKQFDIGAPAASGHLRSAGDVPPGATGIPINPIKLPSGKGITTMPKISEQIAALEEARKGKALRLEEIQKTASDAGRTKDENERKEFDTLRNEVNGLDAEITDLKDVESLHTVKTAKPLPAAAGPAATVPARAKSKLEKGIAFAQLVKVKAVAKLEGERKIDIAVKMYGPDSDVVGIIKAGEQVPGSTVSGTWGYDLISQEGAAAADFAEVLRASTILGKFGQGNVPALRSVPFRKPLILQTGGAVGNWVGEGKPKPVDQLDFDRSVLAPLKCATIVVLTEENVRDSSPSSDMIVRDDLRKALAQLEDEAFITPTNAGSSGIKPAGILYTAGADYAIASESYSDETDVILDIRSLMQRYINANNPAGSAVLIMEEGTALAAGLILNALGQRAFPGLGMKGGELQGIPVITSENCVAGVVTIVNAQDVLYADLGEVAVDMSREASVEMKDSGNITQSGIAGTGASLVSLWQNNLVGIRAEHTVNWKPRRPAIGAYLTGVAWGGAVNVS